MIPIEWILLYLVPATLVFFFATRERSVKARSIIVHVGLIISIVLLTIAGAQLRERFQAVPLLCLFGATLIALYLLSKIGIAYAASSIIQEYCLLLSAILLAYQTRILWAALLSALVYAGAHLIDRGHWQSKFFITLTWGICSILLYFWIQQPLFNFAIHIIGGSLLIKKGILWTSKDHLINS